MISHITICISMDETTPFDGYLQINKGCIGITGSVQLGTKSACTCRKILYFHLDNNIYMHLLCLKWCNALYKVFPVEKSGNKYITSACFATSSYSLTFLFYPEYWQLVKKITRSRSEQWEWNTYAAIVNMLKPGHYKTFHQYGEEVFLIYVQQ